MSVDKSLKRKFFGAIDPRSRLIAGLKASTADVDTIIGASSVTGHLGTFTGITIPDNQPVKPALQALETAVETKITAATLAASGGADLVGAADGTTVQDAISAYPDDLPVGLTPAILRTILLDAQVSRMLSGTGDGSTVAGDVTAETAKFQALIDTERSFSVPQPATTYTVNSLTLRRGQTIEGSGAFGVVDFTGNGTDPIFLLGDGGVNPYREQTLRDMNLTNAGGNCIKLRTAPDFVFDRITASSTGAHTIDGELSVRGTIRDSRVLTSGAFTAIKLLDFFNGLVMQGVTATGGSAGRALQLGSTSGATIDGLRIESSLDGAWFGSTADTGDGICSGLVLRNFYSEQCKTPLVLGKQFKMQGLDASGIFISNNLTTVIAAREACIQMGRVSGTMRSVNLYPHSTEDLLWLYLQDAAGGFGDFNMQPPDVVGTYNNELLLLGTYAANASVKASVGGVVDLGVLGQNRIGSPAVREWTSPLIDSSTSISSKAWLTDASKVLGGKIISAEIVDYDGGALTGVQLAIGRTAAPTENYNVADMATLSFTEGQTALTLAGSAILDGSNSIYRLITAAGATGKFRLKIRYRAN